MLGNADVEDDALGGVLLGDVRSSGLGSFIGLVSNGKGAKVCEQGGRCEEGGECHGGAEMKFEEGVGDVGELGHEREGGREGGMLSGSRECLQKV